MKDNEKQIEVNKIIELIRPLNIVCDNNDCEKCPCSVENRLCTEERVARVIIEHYQPKLPKDSVVLSKGEAERLSSSHDIIFCDNKDCPDNLLCRCCEISECPKNIPEYNEKLSANKHKLELFQKLCKERERADSWEDRYKLLEEELKQSSKETAEKYHTLMNDCIKSNLNIRKNKNTFAMALSRDNDELAKQFGVEIKE